MVSDTALQRRPKGFLLAVGLLCWISFIHLSGIYLFTRGFLLSRLSLSNVGSCADGQCATSATHKRLVFIIIDALRFDFISPDPPSPVSPFHHNILTLPRELSAKSPSRSFMFQAYSDPPTTTLQRIKGITTGSLPTFVDVTSNFGASSIEEDSLINQLDRAGKKIAFMGDDTWMTVFPTTFSNSNTTFPYDSFNVEDLHSVDDGVIRHIFPLLSEASPSWDVLIGHFLGADHVGHRVGPDHPTMKAKLAQMDDVLRRVVDLLHEDTLLVVMGDHGMDRKGDHGGDGELETASALWVYSKGPPLRALSLQDEVPLSLLPLVNFPGASVPHRSVQQIDLVPTLSLLLGLPIPYNNLGTVIPELFFRSLGRDGIALTHAMKLNALQIKTYLDTYRGSASGRELDGVWESLEKSWSATNMNTEDKPELSDLFAYHLYTRYALSVCRSLWAKFDVVLMTLGLVVIFFGVITTLMLYNRLTSVSDWEKWAGKRMLKVSRNFIAGAIVGAITIIPLRPYMEGITSLHAALFASSIASCGIVVLDSLPVFRLPSTITSLPLPLTLHVLAFLSNSFTVWEDRIVLFLLVSSLVPSILVGLAAPTTRLRVRILGYALLYAVCVRVMAVSTVCREEQQPFCHVTFYASSTLPSPPLPILILAIPTSIALPSAIRYFLRISSADKGLVPRFLSYVLQPALLGGNICWFLEWIESSESFGAGWSPHLRILRTVLARCTLGSLVVGASTLWWLNPLCVELHVREDPKSAETKKRHVSVLGFSNAFGAPFLLFFCILFGVVHLSTQLTGQVVLSLAVVALLAYLEVADSTRDVAALNAQFAGKTPSAILDRDTVRGPSAPFTFNHVTAFALLAVHTFHGTGHQSTLSSLQWKTAFLLTPRLSYPTSPLLVITNTFGPIFLLSMAVVLLAAWQFPPLPQPEASARVLGEAVRAALGMMLYFSTLLVGSAASSAWLRRHLMVWKIFAPRFMNAAASLLVVDLALLVGVSVGLSRTVSRVSLLFKKMG